MLISSISHIDQFNPAINFRLAIIIIILNHIIINTPINKHQHPNSISLINHFSLSNHSNLIIISMLVNLDILIPIHITAHPIIIVNLNNLATLLSNIDQ
jgi:hypothetical protein